MALTASNMLELGTNLPNFELKEADGGVLSHRMYKDKALLVAFICNHCPYVKHIADAFSRLAIDLAKKGIFTVAINSNDVSKYPEDSPEKMLEEKIRRGYIFPYLFDETQEIARTFKAACTPDFYLFNRNHLLVYRGQFDSSRPGNGIIPDGKDIWDAALAMIENRQIPTNQIASIGCNIKWIQA